VRQVLGAIAQFDFGVVEDEAIKNCRPVSGPAGSSARSCTSSIADSRPGQRRDVAVVCARSSASGGSSHALPLGFVLDVYCWNRPTCQARLQKFLSLLAALFRATTTFGRLHCFGCGDFDCLAVPEDMRRPNFTLCARMKRRAFLSGARLFLAFTNSPARPGAAA
jgi:hypothetical protein